MANTKLFNSLWGTKNEAGGTAHKMEPKLALAQLATTSCLNNTLYVSAEKQLGDILTLAAKVPAEYIAKLAVYSREKYHMKDVPALLVAILAANQRNDLLAKVFPKVINNGDMLRNFFQMVRSGQVGRRSFGTLPKRLMTNWFNGRTPSELFDQSVGTPSMRDVLRCIRPRPLDRTRSAMYAWLVGKSYDTSLLPEKVREYENWKAVGGDVPNVDFRFLTNVPLSTEQWTQIASRAGWTWLLKNLNNMVKHGVSTQPGMVEMVAARLRDEKAIKRARAFPYRILTAWQNTRDIPQAWRDAMKDAMEIATRNVPTIESKSGDPLYLLMDVSKSMTFPVTGSQYGLHNRATTSMKCVDVAALIACCLLRQNKSELYCFNKELVNVPVDPSAGVMDNATTISGIANGGTACSVPLKHLNDTERTGGLVVLLSDNQSWVESMNIDRYGRKQPGESALQTEWKRWKERNPGSKLVCLDVAPYTTTQVQERVDVLNIGGFSDNVFNLIGQFADGSMSPDHLVGIVEGVSLDGETTDGVAFEEE